MKSEGEERPVPPREESMREALERLQANELEAMRFYAGVAERARDPEVGRLMRHLADFERGHYESLMEAERRMEEAGSPDQDRHGPPVLPRDLRIVLPGLSGAESLMATIEEAADLELRAQSSFERAAERASKPGQRRFFLAMAAEERRHYLILKEVGWSLTNLGAWEPED